MKILYAASEALPFIASGGLADVAGSLPKAIRNRQHACRVVLPLYSEISPELRQSLKFVCCFNVPLSWRSQYCGVFEANHNGVIYYFLDNEYYFKRSSVYGFFDDAERFAFFSKAILEMLLYIEFAPDIIHCNDWQTALVPVYLNLFFRDAPKLADVKTVFTIHNIQYQGRFSPDILSDVLGIPDSMSGTLMMDGDVNLMKAAIEQADLVTTVSPSYAKEILDPWYAFGLDTVLRAHGEKLHGIVNGIDTALYNPQSDPLIFEQYSAEFPQGKAVNKLELQKLAGLAHEPEQMLLGLVTRLVAPKGLELVEYAFDEIMAAGISVVLIGAGDHRFERFFSEMAYRYPGKAAFIRGFNPSMARKIYAGADVLLMPSKMEPCGIAQMIALRYGTIPIVRLTGGLQDTVRDAGQEDGNGLTFLTYNAHDMLNAVKRAKALYEQPEQWSALMQKAMNEDLGWSKSAGEYIRLYKMLAE